MTDQAMRRFVGKTVLVTGAGAGIGKAIAEEFAKEGAILILVDRDAANGEAVAASIRAGGADVSFISADVSIPADVADLFATIAARPAPLDIAINNAGIEGTVALLEDQPDANFERVVGVNIFGTFQCMREEVKLMKPRGAGVIINFASIAAHVGFAGLTVYTASKAAVLAMTKSAALELARTGVRVASVSPGLVDTAMLDRFFAADPKARATMSESLPLGRPCTAHEIARGTLYLASEDGALVLGQTLNLDGGWAYVKS
ncbi:SDR family NAD(P)-dependent oxidoreductase [Flavisphingomonas formosensis]|uniref:SDR family NAD(P)-dependent oxidoreductase n=1 Tax=Flavisphingomonas formosensis TaxID=861534 RepID=UPI0012FC7C28|nr:SDR family NAD(P)-dependent oxidoreductase [Sphingomonas formosensis]